MIIAISYTYLFERVRNRGRSGVMQASKMKFFCVLLSVVFIGGMLAGCPNAFNTVLVPDVNNMAQSEAELALASAELVLGRVTEAYHASIAIGAVIRQYPEAGDTVTSGSSVDLTLSKGPEPIAVPDIVSMSRSAAEMALASAGLTVEGVTKAYSASVPAGAVIRQEPVAGTRVALNSAVHLVLSKGLKPVNMPDITGMSQTAAESVLGAVGLTIETVTEVYSDSLPVGEVMSQEPAAGSSVAPNGRVRLVVSKGVAPVAVPNVVGMSQSDAESTMIAVALVVGAVMEAYHAEVPAGQVLQQEPAAGTSVPVHSRVRLVISKGPEPVSVPNFVGMLQSEVESTLSSLALTVGEVILRYSDSTASGCVMEQHPEAGEHALPGSTVTLVVSQGIEPVLVPDVMGMLQSDAESTILDAGLTVGTVTEEYHATASAGQVFRQEPAVGERVAPESGVSLVLSKGLDLSNVTYTFDRMWPEFTLSYFSFPLVFDIAIDSSGYMYMPDFWGNCIQKFTPDGEFCGGWGTKGTEPGAFDYIYDIEIDSLDNIYIVDRENYRIQKFTSDGEFITEWGSRGTGPGQFYGYFTIAIDAFDHVYVRDVGSSRIQKFASDGTFILQWSFFDADSTFWVDSVFEFWFVPCGGISTDSSGNVYLVGGKSIQKFTPEGVFLMEFGSEDAVLSKPMDIAIDSNDAVYVFDGGNYSIRKFTTEGVWISSWTGNRKDVEKSADYGAITVDRWGNLYEVVFYANSVRKISPTGTLLKEYDKLDSFVYWEEPVGIATDAADNVYVVDKGAHRVRKYTSAGAPLAQWGTWGAASGQFNGPAAIAVDAQDNVYVVDLNNARIQKFTSEGVFLSKFPIEPVSDYWGDWHSVGIEVDAGSNIYVSNSINGRICKYASDGTLLLELNYTNGFASPAGVAVDMVGNIYVVGNQHVTKYDAKGELLLEWGSYGHDKGEFNDPIGIALDSFGNVYVADSDNHRIQKFTSDGVFLESWKLEEFFWTESGESPYAIAVDKVGNVFVTDAENGCVQKFRPVMEE